MISFALRLIAVAPILLAAFAPVLLSSFQAGAQNQVLRTESAAGTLAGAGAAASLPLMPQGVVYALPAPAATAGGTAEQTLGTYSLPANALDVVGRTVRVTASFKHGANTNNVTPKLYLGTPALATAVNATSGGAAAVISVTAMKTGASAQSYHAWGIGGALGVVPVTAVGTATDTDTAPIVIKATCTDGTDSAGDCILETMLVEYLN